MFKIIENRPWKLGLLQIATKFITNCDKILLQIAAADLLQTATNLLQITIAITNCHGYYKLRQNNHP